MRSDDMYELRKSWFQVSSHIFDCSILDTITFEGQDRICSGIRRTPT